MHNQIYGGANIAPLTNNFFALGRDLSTEEFSGFYTRQYSSREIKKYDLIYYDITFDEWAPAQANSLKTLPAKGISLTTALAHEPIDVLLYGEVYNPNWDFSNYINKFAYVDIFTPGAITTFDHLDYSYRYRNPVGIITNKNQIFFHFYQLWFNNIDEGFN